MCQHLENLYNPANILWNHARIKDPFELLDSPINFSITSKSLLIRFQIPHCNLYAATTCQVWCSIKGKRIFYYLKRLLRCSSLSQVNICVRPEFPRILQPREHIADWVQRLSENPAPLWSQTLKRFAKMPLIPEKKLCHFYDFSIFKGVKWFTPENLSTTYITKGPGDTLEVFTIADLGKYCFSLSANRLPSSVSPPSALGACSPPNTTEEEPGTRDGDSSTLPAVSVPPEQKASNTHLHLCTLPTAGWCWTCLPGSEGRWGRCEHSRFWDWNEGSQSPPLTSWQSYSGTD